MSQTIHPADESSRHVYPMEGIWGEALRAALGLILGIGLMTVASPGGIVFLVGVVLALLFLAFAAGVWIRRRTVLTLDSKSLTADTGLPAAMPFGLGYRQVDWAEMRGMSLRYFSTRRDRSGGWMQLTLKGRRGRISVLSTVSDFPWIARRAEAAARRNGLTLGTATQRNLLALGSIGASGPRR